MEGEEMTDYIKGSPEIYEWLIAQGVPKEALEPDKFAPCVWYSTKSEDRPMVRLYGDVSCVRTVCPYYGPGGEGNTLKALRGLEEKRIIAYPKLHGNLHDADGAPLYWVGAVRLDVKLMGTKVDGEGSSDGEALYALLVKIMEESKNE